MHVRKKDESSSLERTLIHDRFIVSHILGNLGVANESFNCEESLAWLFVLVVEVVAFVESNVVLDAREHLQELSGLKFGSLLTRIHLVPQSSDLRVYINDLKFRSSDRLERRESHGHLVALSHHLVDLTLGTHHLLTLEAGTHHLFDLTLDIHLGR